MALVKITVPDRKKITITPALRQTVGVYRKGDKGDKGDSGESQEWVIGETPSGAVDGSNATFTTEFNFIPESVELFCGGVRLSVLSDFNTSGNQTITFYVSPKMADLIRVNYQKL